MQTENEFLGSYNNDPSDGRVRARAWLFTVNNYLSSDIRRLRGLDCEYIIFGYETAPSTGTPHLQGYVYFRNARSKARVRKLVGGHVIKADGSPKENQVYCSKGGLFEERGTLPSDPGDAGGREQDRWAAVLSNARKGHFESIPPDIFIRYRSTLHAIWRDELSEGLEDSSGLNKWYWGETGTGKSRAARELCGDLYVKGIGKWWDGYRGQHFVLIEDLDRRDKDTVRELKLWCDRYPCRVEYKGGSMMVRPKCVIVTSNYHPNEIWEHLQDREPIMRRFEVTEFKKIAGAKVTVTRKKGKAATFIAESDEEVEERCGKCDSRLCAGRFGVFSCEVN